MSEEIKRATVYLEAALHRSLRVRAAEAGTTLSDLVNRAVKAGLGSATEVREPAFDSDAALATEISELTGESRTEAVRRALEERLARLRRDRQARRLADQLDEIAASCSSLPVRDDRTADEILGYDERGLPD